jgi:hypothetical protein
MCDTARAINRELVMSLRGEERPWWWPLLYEPREPRERWFARKGEAERVTAQALTAWAFDELELTLAI